MYPTLENLQNEPCFSDAIKEGKTVYLTVKSETENLPYLLKTYRIGFKNNVFPSDIV